MRKTLATLTTLAALGVGHADASDTLICSGELSFIQGANTSISCAGDLWLGGGLTLSSAESIFIHADSNANIFNATLSAPQIFIEAGGLLSLSSTAQIQGPLIGPLDVQSNRESSSVTRTRDSGIYTVNPGQGSGVINVDSGSNVTVIQDGRIYGLNPDLAIGIIEFGAGSTSDNRISDAWISLLKGASTYDPNLIFLPFDPYDPTLAFQYGGAPQVVSGVPEPEQYALFLSGLGLIATRLRRRT